MKTFISPLLTSVGDVVQRAKDAPPICWLDEFLEDAELKRPISLNRPLIVLLSGPPGAGKSLLAQQMCYNQAHAVCNRVQGSLPSLIITSETTSTALIHNLAKLGFEQRAVAQAGAIPARYLYDTLDQNGNLGRIGNHVGAPVMLITEINGITTKPSISTFTRQVKDAWDKALDNQVLMFDVPSILVVDSLNVFSDVRSRRKLFRAIRSLFPRQPSYLFLVLDTPEVEPSISPALHQDWEFIADVSIRVDYAYGTGDYFARHFEIVKARLQGHVLGKHLVKIVKKPDISPRHGWVRQPGAPGRLVVDPEGAMPYIESGGLFVFPSVHYVLSRTRTRQQLVYAEPIRPAVNWGIGGDYTIAPQRPAEWGPGDIAPLNVQGAPVRQPVTRDDWEGPNGRLNWPVEWCYELVGGGVLLNQCTAIIGHRGARKSYFAYQFILDGIANGERTLVLSFRDDPEAVRGTLSAILQAPKYVQYGLTALPNNPNNPEIIYQRPGYVAPEELLHRVITAVGEHNPTRAVINAVDQWEASYPLLAASPILLPALIDFLNVHKVTSMVVGVERAGGPTVGRGLTSQAEVVLSFEYCRIPWPPLLRPRASHGPVEDSFAHDVELLQHQQMWPSTSPKVVVRARRVPRAEAGFGRAVLEYLPTAHGQAAGLVMHPLAPEYHEGEPIS